MVMITARLGTRIGTGIFVSVLKQAAAYMWAEVLVMFTYTVHNIEIIPLPKIQ